MAKETKKDMKNKKHFFKDFKAELKKVIWPTPEQLVKNTLVVIVLVLVTAAIVFVLDVLFDVINNKGINKIKENIRSSVSVQTQENNNVTFENVSVDSAKDQEEANNVSEE